MLNYVFYHGSDNDGKCSGSLIMRELTDDVRLIPWNYGKTYDIIYFLAANETPDNIYLVDISIKPSEMRLILEMGINVIWYDHHLTPYETYKDDSENGFRIDENGNVIDTHSNKTIGVCSISSGSAAKIVYDNFTQNKTPLMDKIINYVSTWDIFDKSDERLWEEAIIFNLGTGITNVEDMYYFWSTLFTNQNIFDGIMNDGKVIYSYKKTENEKISKSSGILEWEGIRFVAINGGAGSLQLETASSVYGVECQLTFSYSIPYKSWRVSLYANPEADVDLSKIAQKYGGGGHSHACGFSCEELPFDVKTIEYDKMVWKSV